VPCSTNDGRRLHCSAKGVCRQGRYQPWISSGRQGWRQDLLLGRAWGRPYPSIWYRRDWQDYEDEFDYDELQEIPRNRLTTELDAGELKKVLEQTQNLATSRQVCAYFDQAERPPVRHSSPSSQVEVHVAAACFDRSTGRVLMRQRRHGKEVEKPHQWDFGCA